MRLYLSGRHEVSAQFTCIGGHLFHALTSTNELEAVDIQKEDSSSCFIVIEVTIETYLAVIE